MRDIILDRPTIFKYCQLLSALQYKAVFFFLFRLYFILSLLHLC